MLETISTVVWNLAIICFSSLVVLATVWFLVGFVKALFDKSSDVKFQEKLESGEFVEKLIQQVRDGIKKDEQ